MKKCKKTNKRQCPNIHKTGVHLFHRTLYDGRDAPPFENPKPGKTIAVDNDGDSPAGTSPLFGGCILGRGEGGVTFGDNDL